MKTLKIISVILMTSFLFMACEKLDDKTKDSSKSVFSSGTNYYWEEVEGYVIANVNNPVDSFGYIHNMLLGEIEKACSYGDSLDYIYSICDSVWEAHYGETDFDFSVADQYLEIIQEEKGEYWLDTLPANDFTKDCIIELIDIVYEYDVTNFGYIITKIKSFEDSLIDMYDLETIKNILLGSSIARYSLAYWHDRLCEDEGKSLQSKAPSDWDWMKITVAACDVIGGVGLAITTSATGVGWLAVSFAGIRGAVATSAAAGSLWDRFFGKQSE